MRSNSTISIGDLAADRGLVGGPFGSLLVGSDYVTSGIPVIRGSNMDHGVFLGGSYVFVTGEKVKRDLSRSVAQPGDLVFTQRGTLGQVAIVPSGAEQRYVVSQSQMRLRVRSDLADARYVYYACTSSTFKKQVADHAISTGVPHINLGILSRLEISLFSIDKQKAIADVLGALDDKISANRRTIQTIREICRSIFSRETSTKAMKPESVSIKQLLHAGALVVSDGYRTKRSELSRSGYRIIRVADIGEGEVSLRGPDFVSGEYADAIGGKAGKSGDILLTTKGTVGRLAVVRELNERIVYSPQLCFFRVNENELVDHWYLRYWFESAEFLQQASHRMNNSDMAPYINLADIRSLRITLPPIESQRKLSRTLDALESEVGALQQESRTLAETRDLLLPALMSGKLRVRDAEKQLEAVV